MGYEQREFQSGRILAYDKVARTETMRYIDYGLGFLTGGPLKSSPSGVV